jgi:hypothetical protein
VDDITIETAARHKANGSRPLGPAAKCRNEIAIASHAVCEAFAEFTAAFWAEHRHLLIVPSDAQRICVQLRSPAREGCATEAAAPPRLPQNTPARRGLDRVARHEQQRAFVSCNAELGALRPIMFISYSTSCEEVLPNPPPSRE